MKQQIEIRVPLQECLRCGYQWISRRGEKIPLRCAKCRSPYWQSERRKKKAK